ncbi:MAG: glycosyltransferase family 4 protein [Chloroflexi bacterium]|nr:glycosyltransferase family 4 protein [Chloroflexota bacterium]
MNDNTAAIRRESTPKRHCMVVLAHYPLAETRVQREAEALAAHGFKVDVICLRGRQEAPQEHYRDVRIFRLPVQLKKKGLARQFANYLHFFILAALKLTQLHIRQPYDTIQTHNLPDFLIFCALIPKLTGIPVILDLHDLMPEFYAGRFGQSKNSLLGRLIRWQEHLSCAFANHVITVSEHWRQALIKRGVPAHKCSVVMNVADPDIFSPSEDDEPPPLDQAKVRLIYHGTLVERYGLDLAIQAVNQARREISNVHLTILGRGKHVPTLKQMIRELDLDDHVTIHDELRPAEELPEIIRTANLGIVPYRNDVFTDGLLPTKLMEYAALGLPAIAARTTAIEAYFGDAMVEFFEPGDVDDLARCIRTLYENPGRLAELAQKSEKFNQQYNWAKIGAEYVALVERLGNL